MKKETYEKHPILKIRKPATPSTKVFKHPKYAESKMACRGKINPRNYEAD